MKALDNTNRRGFLGRLFGAAAAASLPAAAPFATTAAAQTQDPDGWIKEVPGTQRTLFDSPRHMNGWALIHIFNYLNTYNEAYKMTPGQQVGAVGTFYAMGPTASIPLAFNDMIWEKYAIGEYMGLKDASGKPFTYNVYTKLTPENAGFVFTGNGLPLIPEMAPLAAALAIPNLQKMGTKFLLCNNALGGWIFELAARGKGKPDAIEKDLRANILPGVTVVPAMVIAIEKAQRAGMAYNRQ
jgi:intracellular sulfur oxidation DsrE/DsrF family protein